MLKLKEIIVGGVVILSCADISGVGKITCIGGSGPDWSGGGAGAGGGGQITILYRDSCSLDLNTNLSTLGGKRKLLEWRWRSRRKSDYAIF